VTCVLAACYWCNWSSRRRWQSAFVKWHWSHSAFWQRFPHASVTQVCTHVITDCHLWVVHFCLYRCSYNGRLHRRLLSATLC